MDAPSPIVTSGAIRADGSIPTSGLYGGKNSASTRAKSNGGFALTMVAHGVSSTRSAGTIAHDAALARNAAAYFGPDAKVIAPRPAASIDAGVTISVAPSPLSTSFRFAAISLSFKFLPFNSYREIVTSK